MKTEMYDISFQLLEIQLLLQQRGKKKEKKEMIHMEPGALHHSTQYAYDLG